MFCCGQIVGVSFLIHTRPDLSRENFVTWHGIVGPEGMMNKRKDYELDTLTPIPYLFLILNIVIISDIRNSELNLLSQAIQTKEPQG